MKKKCIKDRFIIKTLLKVLCILPIKNNRILCLNFNGKGYGENPKYIVESLCKKNKDLEIYWVVNDKEDKTLPDNIKKVKYKSLEYFKILYTSKVLINNTRFGTYFDKRKGQLYIQTWHGCLGTKKIENDALEKLPNGYEKLMKHDSNMIDVMISSNDFFSELCRKAFLYDGKVLKVGCPKNDILINENQSEIKASICNEFNINSESFLVIYVPTFRDSYDHKPYDIDFKLLKETISKKYNKKCEVIIKLHPIAVDKYTFDNYDDFINANKYSDTQKLLLAGDVIITDYSSVMFDGLIADKPVIVYAKDIDEYNKERGTYFTLKELPFPISKNNEELIDIITDKDINGIKANYVDFRNKVNLIENGNASDKISKLIINYINGEKDE